MIDGLGTDVGIWVGIVVGVEVEKPGVTDGVEVAVGGSAVDVASGKTTTVSTTLGIAVASVLESSLHQHPEAIRRRGTETRTNKFGRKNNVITELTMKTCETSSESSRFEMDSLRYTQNLLELH